MFEHNCIRQIRCITQLAKMSIDSKFVELTADELQVFFQKGRVFVRVYLIVQIFKAQQEA